MEINIFQSTDELGDFAANKILQTIKAHNNPVIGLATGSSPVPLYKAWGKKARQEKLDMSVVTAFALDEYCGLPEDHPESYHSVIAREAVNGIGLDPKRVHVPSGIGDVAKNAREYDLLIKNSGGIHLQILGIGRSGHLGFNEPGSPFDSRTREVQLFPETISDNARFFDSIKDVPTTAITQGLGTIREAQQLLIVATGSAKASAVQASIQGPVTVETPASIAQTHPNVVWCLDEEAAKLL